MTLRIGREQFQQRIGHGRALGRQLLYQRSEDGMHPYACIVDIEIEECNCEPWGSHAMKDDLFNDR